MYIALGTVDVTGGYHIVLYDPEDSRVAATCDARNEISILCRAGDSGLVYAAEDYIYGLKIERSGSTLTLKELFWTVASAKVLQLAVVELQGEKWSIAAGCADLYLRIFENETFLNEQRMFTKTKLVKLHSFGSYVAALAATGRFRLYFIEKDQIKLLSSCELGQVGDFELVFKPFAPPLGQSVGTLEAIVGVDAPLPFVITMAANGQDGALLVYTLENQQLVLKKLLSMAGATQVIRRTSDQDLFALFYSQYRESFRLS